MSEIVYICDGNYCDNKTWGTPSCKMPGDIMCRCLHTTDPAHAKFGPCEDPENHPERFKQLENGEFWEVER